MCFMSLVMDQYRPYVPQTWPPNPHVFDTLDTKVSPPLRRPTTADELRELIESFKEAVKAAATFDRVTGQPDCEDPEKAKLIERVAELEAKLDEIAEAAQR